MTAVETGVFERHGLEVELLEPAPGPENVRRVAEGGSDFCLTSVTHYLHARESYGPLPARFVAIVTQRTPLAAFVVAGRPISTDVIPIRASDVAGARIAGTEKSALTRELVAHLRARGHEPGELVDVAYGDAMRALADAEVDAVADFIDLLPRMRRRVPNVNVSGLRLCDDGATHYGSGLVTSDRNLAERPAMVGAFVDAVRDAWEATRDDPARGTEAFVRRYPQVDPQVVVECWRETERLIFAGPPGQLDPARWEQTLRHIATAQGLPMPEPQTTYALIPMRRPG